MIGNIALLVVSKENLFIPYIFSPVSYAVSLSTLVMNGILPIPRALTAGRDRLPPSIRFHTICSTEKFFAGERLPSLYALVLPNHTSSDVS